MGIARFGSPEVVLIGQTARAVEGAGGPGSRRLQGRLCVVVAGVTLEIDQTADEFFPRVWPHLGIAVRPNRLPPPLEQRDGLVAQRVVTCRAAQAGHTTEELAKDDRA